MKTEELYEFIKDNHQNQTFSEIIDIREPVCIYKDIEQDMIVIQYLRLISRDPQIMYQMISPNSTYNLFGYLNSMKYFYLGQPNHSDSKQQLVILELLQTIKRVDNKRQILTDVHSNLINIFQDYLSNIQYLNYVLIELIISLCNYKSYIHKLEEYLVNPNCNQNKLKAMLHIQQNIHKFIQNYSIFRYIFIMGQQILIDQLDTQQKDQNYLVQYLSILQQMIINKNVKINKLKNQIVYLQFLFDNISQIDIISQMILLQIIFHLSLDFRINQVLFTRNEIHIQNLLVNYQTVLNYDETYINQQTQLQREILQQLFRILRQFYIFEKQRQNIKYILDVDILQQFIQIEDIYEIEEYQFLVDNYIKIHNQQYIHRFQSIFSDDQDCLALSNMNSNNKINDYQVIKKLGKGAYGIVYLVQKDKANQCAMKEIQEKSVFQQELKVVESFNHNNLIKYIEHFQTVESNYIVFQYIDGVSLAQLIEFKRYQQNSQFKKYKLDIKSVVSQLVQGVFYLHKKGIIHRDINPTNIMIDLDNRLQLIDFGFGQFINKKQTVSSNNIFKKKKTRSDHININSSENQITNISNDYIQISQNSPTKEKEQRSHRQFVGTLAYTAPEVVNSQEYNELIDIWSLGCVFYELLYYKPLYRIENVLQLANEIIKGNIIFEELDYDLFQDRSFVDKLLRITKKCLQKQSNERISINQIVQELMDIIIDNNEKQNQYTNRNHEYMNLIQKMNQKVEDESKEQNILKQIQKMFNENNLEYISHFENILQKKKQNIYIGEQMEEIEYNTLYRFIYS